jgi:hypothetical protein
LIIKAEFIMKSEEPAKVWHAVDAKKGKYFLVDTIPQNSRSSKKTVIFHGEQYQVLSEELMQYDPNKPQKLSELRHLSEP